MFKKYFNILSKSAPDRLTKMFLALKLIPVGKKIIFMVTHKLCRIFYFQKENTITIERNQIITKELFF